MAELRNSNSLKRLPPVKGPRELKTNKNRSSQSNSPPPADLSFSFDGKAHHDLELDFSTEKNIQTSRPPKVVEDSGFDTSPPPSYKLPSVPAQFDQSQVTLSNAQPAIDFNIPDLSDINNSPSDTANNTKKNSINEHTEEASPIPKIADQELGQSFAGIALESANDADSDSQQQEYSPPRSSDDSGFYDSSSADHQKITTLPLRQTQNHYSSDPNPFTDQESSHNGSETQEQMFSISTNVSYQPLALSNAVPQSNSTGAVSHNTHHLNASDSQIATNYTHYTNSQHPNSIYSGSEQNFEMDPGMFKGYDSDYNNHTIGSRPLRKQRFGSGTDIGVHSQIFRQSIYNLSSTSLSRASMNFNQKSNRVSRTLLDSKSALEMYRDAALKTNDERIQLEYAKFLIDTIETLDNGQSFSLSNTFRPMSIADISMSLPGNQSHGNDSSGSNNNSVLDFKADSSELIQQNDQNKTKLVKEAFYWLNLLQKKSNAEACFILGSWYEAGINGIPQDASKAHRCFMQAAKLHHAKAAFKVAEHYEFKKQNSQAVSYYAVAAAMADASSNYRMATALLRSELGQKKDIKKAIIYLRRAAELANTECPDGAYVLGLMYLEEYPEKKVNDIVFIDSEEAHKQLDRAANLGMPEAQHKLGHLFEFGEHGFPADPYASITYYRMAAEQNFALSQMALSGWYLSGASNILEQSDSLAYDWCFKAAELGLPRAQFGMGYYYDIGIGVERDLEKAILWYNRAADNGNLEAVERLEKIKNEQMPDNPVNLRRNVTKSRKARQSSKKSPKGDSKSKEMCILM